MLPFILGGVALAATGYGIKEYCDSVTCDTTSEVVDAGELIRDAFERTAYEIEDLEESDLTLDDLRELRSEITGQFEEMMTRIDSVLKQAETNVTAEE